MKLVSVETMKDLESAANAEGYSYEKMMITAGRQLARIIHARFKAADQNTIMGIIGGGNNGGDTLIALTELQKAGWSCCALFCKTDAQPQGLITEFSKSGGKCLFLLDQSNAQLLVELKAARIILDGIFGTGFTLPMRSPYVEALILIEKNIVGKIVVAVDCPSGVDCETGKASPETIHADLTVCMEAVKNGLLKFPAYEFCGEIITVDLGIPAHLFKELKSVDEVIDRDIVRKVLPKRPMDSHKGSFGHVIICGGSVNYPGAPVLAGKAAYRVGAGLVQTAIPERIFEVAAGANLESIWLLLDDEDGVIEESASITLLEKLSQVTCLLIGSGMGQEETTLKFFNRIVFKSSSNDVKTGMGFIPNNPLNAISDREHWPFLVIDADGLRLLAKTTDWHSRLKTQAILTPHPGEMAGLTGLTVEEIQKDRLEVARRYARQWGHIVVLKGALTVIAQPDGKTWVIPFANAALAKAGTGDVLAGMITGLAGQGIPLNHAAIAGVWLHAQAALLLLKKVKNNFSIYASEILDLVPEVIGNLK